jgi:molybdopterin-guanine dinucleotide biosynthesis protein A
MPYVELPYIDYMRQRLVTGEYQACATCREGRLEPFHAFYSSSSLPQLEADLAQGLYSVTRFLKKINTLIIPEEEAAPYVPGWRAFLNLNTPEEYRKFRGELGGAG